MKFLLSILLLISVSYSQFTFGTLTGFEHDATYGLNARVKQVGDAMNYAVCYLGDGGTGEFVTLSVNPSTYAITEIDQFQYSAVAIYSDVAVIDSTHVVVAYEGADNDGYVQILSMDTAKDNIASIEILEYEPNETVYTQRIHLIDATHFIVGYCKGDNTGWAKTFSFDGSYQNITVLDSLQVEALATYAYFEMEEITTNAYVCAYGYTDHNIISTFTIDGSYQFTMRDSLDHDTGTWQTQGLEIPDATHILQVYMSGTNDGEAKTFSVDGTYQITQIDSINWGGGTLDLVGSYEADLIKSSAANQYVFDYSANSNDGYLRSFTLDESYNITAQADSFYYTNDRLNGNIIEVDATHIFSVFQGNDNDGWSEVNTATPPVTGWSKTINGVTSPTSVDGVTSITSIDGVL